MDLKRILNPDDTTTPPRPLKRQSPSSSHLPSSPTDVYETSSQPTDAGAMGNVYSYFSHQSSPSPSSSPQPVAGDVSRSNGANCIFRQDLDPQSNSSTSIPSNQNHHNDLDLPKDSPQSAAAPTNTHPEDLDLQDSSTRNAPTQSESGIRLTNLTSDARREYYEALWAGKEIELKGKSVLYAVGETSVVNGYHCRFWSSRITNASAAPVS